jgi:hypothetical protein
MKPNKSELLPIDWAAIKPHYRAGVRSLAQIAKQFGCSHVAILKHAKKHGWARDLKPQIVARADQLVTKAQVTGAVTADSLADRITIEANAQALAMVQLSHRAGGAKYRERNLCMLTQLDCVDDNPELFVQIRDMLEAIETEECATPTPEQQQQMRDAIAVVANLPARAKLLKDLVDSYSRIVAIEREAFGLNSEQATDGRPMVIIKDYTGRGDADSAR